MPQTFARLSELCPSKCATLAVEEIVTLHPAEGHLDADIIAQVVRRTARDIYEQCARLAQDWVADHDQTQRLSGLDVGDAIAELFRKISDERCSERIVAELADAAVLGTAEATRAGSIPVDPTKPERVL